MEGITNDLKIRRAVLIKEIRRFASSHYRIINFMTDAQLKPLTDMETELKKIERELIKRYGEGMGLKHANSRRYRQS
jgi:hypothetical protein